MVGVEGVGVVDFQIVVRIRYDGFLLGFGVGTPDGDKTPGRTILVVLEVVDNLGQDETGGFVGKLGWMGLVVVGPTMVLVAV